MKKKKNKIARAVAESRKSGRLVKVTGDSGQLGDILRSVGAVWDGDFSSARIEELAVVWGDGWMVEVEIREEKGVK